MNKLPRYTSHLLLAFLAMGLVSANVGWAEDWPTYGGEPARRGPGFYFAIYKLAMLASVFWLWAFTADWLGRDTIFHQKKHGLKAEIWNPLFVFTFLFIFLIALLIPIFAVTFLLVLLAYAVPLAVYVVLRNPKMPDEDKIFTVDHAKRVIASFGKKKVEETPREPYEYGAQVDFVPQGGNDQTNQANLITARQSPPYVPAKNLIADAIDWRAEKILLDFTADAVSAKYMIDGVWHAMNPKLHDKLPFNREMGDGILQVFKRIANLKPDERRARQDGKFRSDYKGNKHNTTITSQGTQTGERVLINFVTVVKNPPTLEDLGMREAHRQKLKDILKERSQLVVFCSMPGDGLSSTWVAMLKAADRLTRDFVSFEDSNKREFEVENVEIIKHNAAAGETALGGFQQVILREPEVLCVPELSDPEMLAVLLEQVSLHEKNAIIGMRAKEGVEAILRLLALKVDPTQLSQGLALVVNQRLIRKLCDQCKEPFQPAPDLLQKLGIPAGRVQALYRERQPPPPDQEGKKKKKGEPEVCPKCRGLHYYGRTAMYELVVMNDKLRQAMVQQPKLEVLRQVSRASGNFTLQDEGVLMLAQGITSINELQRVMKQ